MTMPEWKSQTECIADEIMPLFSETTPQFRRLVEEAIRRGAAKYQRLTTQARKVGQPK